MYSFLEDLLVKVVKFSERLLGSKKGPHALKSIKSCLITIYTLCTVSTCSESAERVNVHTESLLREY